MTPLRVFNFLLAAMFLVFAFLQLNDPDPVLWIFIYGLMAVICVMAMFDFYQRKYLIAILVIFAAFSFIYVPGVIEWIRQDDKSVLFDDLAKMQYAYVEETREFLGLMICVVVLSFYIIRSFRLARA